MIEILALLVTYTAIGVFVAAALIVCNWRDPGSFTTGDIAEISTGWLYVLLVGLFTGFQELRQYLSETDEEYEMRLPDREEY